MKYILILALFASTVMGGITTLNLDGSSLEFKSVNIDQEGVGFTYRLNDIIGFDMTAFESGGASILAGAGDGAPAVGTRAALLDDDLRFDTGIINPAASSTAMTLVFDQPVFNNKGDDIILFEFDPSAADPRDPIQFRINGVDLTFSDYSGQLFGGLPSDVYNISAPTLSALENNAASFVSSTAQGAFGIGIDLSDFGVPKDTGSVTSIQLGGAGGAQNVDLLFIAGLKEGRVSVPEPSTGMFLFLGIGLVTFIRRSMVTARRENKAA